MKNLISQWAGIIDESKNVQEEYGKFLSESVVKEEDEDLGIEEVQFTEDDLERWAKMWEDDDPTYADVLILAKSQGTKEEDVMTAEEYEELSDVDKEDIHNTAKIDFGDDEPITPDYLRKIINIKGANTSIDKIEKDVNKPSSWVKRSVQITNFDPEGKPTIEASEDETKPYVSKEDAVDAMKNMIRDDSRKYGISPEQMKSSVPLAISKKDPEAIGFMVDEVEGYGERKFDKKKNFIGFSGGYKSIKRLTYVLYNSEKEIDTKAYQDLYKEISKKDD